MSGYEAVGPLREWGADGNMLIKPQEPPFPFCICQCLKHRMSATIHFAVRQHKLDRFPKLLKWYMREVASYLLKWCIPYLLSRQALRIGNQPTAECAIAIVDKEG